MLKGSWIRGRLGNGYLDVPVDVNGTCSFPFSDPRLLDFISTDGDDLELIDELTRSTRSDVALSLIPGTHFGSESTIQVVSRITPRLSFPGASRNSDNKIKRGSLKFVDKELKRIAHDEDKLARVLRDMACKKTRIRVHQEYRLPANVVPRFRDGVIEVDLRNATRRVIRFVGKLDGVQVSLEGWRVKRQSSGNVLGHLSSLGAIPIAIIAKGSSDGRWAIELDPSPVNCGYKPIQILLEQPELFSEQPNDSIDYYEFKCELQSFELSSDDFKGLCPVLAVKFRGDPVTKILLGSHDFNIISSSDQEIELLYPQDDPLSFELEDVEWIEPLGIKSLTRTFVDCNDRERTLAAALGANRGNGTKDRWKEFFARGMGVDFYFDDEDWPDMDSVEDVFLRNESDPTRNIRLGHSLLSNRYWSCALDDHQIRSFESGQLRPFVGTFAHQIDGQISLSSHVRVLQATGDGTAPVNIRMALHIVVVHESRSYTNLQKLWPKLVVTLCRALHDQEIAMHFDTINLNVLSQIGGRPKLVRISDAELDANAEGEAQMRHVFNQLRSQNPSARDIGGGGLNVEEALKEVEWPPSRADKRDAVIVFADDRSPDFGKNLGIRLETFQLLENIQIVEGINESSVVLADETAQSAIKEILQSITRR